MAQVVFIALVLLGTSVSVWALPTFQGTDFAPASELGRVVVKASGFTPAEGSMAMISNLEVQCNPCASTGAVTTEGPTNAQPTSGAQPTGTPAPAPSTVCKDLECDFEAGSLCNYQASGSATQNWHNQGNPFHNRLTVVLKNGQGQEFAGYYMKAKQGEKSTLTANTDFDNDYVVRFDFYMVGDAVSLKGCCNDESTCTPAAKPEVEVNHYQAWKTATFGCPTGTKKVIFLADNTEGANEGAAVVNDIQVLQGANPPDSATQSAC